MYKVLIIDDEPMARGILENYLSKIDTLELVASCGSAAQGFSVLNKENIDLIFLDINMPEVTGLMLAKAIKGKANIIFTTAYREYAVEGFEVDALDYLLKPIPLDRFMQSVNKFINSRECEIDTASMTFTFFRCERKMVKVNFDDILCIEGCGDYLKIYLSNNTLVTRETMTNVIEKLPKNIFMRSHRSYLVSLSKIESYTNEHINLKGKTIPISRSYRENVLHKLETIT